jgi:hypothetical protein
MGKMFVLRNLLLFFFFFSSIVVLGTGSSLTGKKNRRHNRGLLQQQEEEKQQQPRCPVKLWDGSEIEVAEGPFAHPDYCNRDCTCTIEYNGNGGRITKKRWECPKFCVVPSEEDEDRYEVCAEVGETYTHPGTGWECRCDENGGTCSGGGGDDVPVSAPVPDGGVGMDAPSPPSPPSGGNLVTTCTVGLRNGMSMAVPQGKFSHPDYCNRDCTCTVTNNSDGSGSWRWECPRFCVVPSEEDEDRYEVCAEVGETYKHPESDWTCECGTDGGRCRGGSSSGSGNQPDGDVPMGPDNVMMGPGDVTMVPPSAPGNQNLITACTIALRNGTQMMVPQGPFEHPDYCNRNCICTIVNNADGSGSWTMQCPKFCVVVNEQDEDLYDVCAEVGETYVDPYTGWTCKCSGAGGSCSSASAPESPDEVDPPTPVPVATPAVPTAGPSVNNNNNLRTSTPPTADIVITETPPSADTTTMTESPASPAEPTAEQPSAAVAPPAAGTPTPPTEAPATAPMAASIGAIEELGESSSSSTAFASPSALFSVSFFALIGVLFL